MVDENLQGNKIRLKLFVKQGWILMLVLLVASFLRILNLGSVGFNSDEAVYAGQAAVLAGNEQLAKYFSIFRAHPLLFQFLVSIVYRFSFGDIQARIVAVTFAIATIYVTYLLGKVLYSKIAGLTAALFLSLMPYHVLVSRQALLDVPLAFASVLSICFLALFVVKREQCWFYLVGISIGIAALSKEVGILLFPVALLSAAMARMLTFRNLIITSTLFILTFATYPLSIILSGATPVSSSYLLWQFSRPPNHAPSYFFDILVQYAGYPFLTLTIIGLTCVIIRRKVLDYVLLFSLVAPLVFFQLWPVKLFPYLLPLVPALVILAGYGFVRLWRHSFHLRIIGAVLILLTLSTFAYSSVPISFYGANTTQNLFGEDVEVLSFAGVREAALWIRDNTPEDSIFMTITPSVANIVEFYSGRRAYALSVSANPANRNPEYAPIIDPDLAIRVGVFDYILIDKYSEQRTSFYAQKIRDYVQKYHGILVHATSVSYSHSLTDALHRSEERIWIYHISQQ